ncbi:MULTISPECIES: ATPase AAA [unclassified Rhizobium]|uniref:ATPase AAA n=1 Tax=unclassified Rhizobium TaxID=2613769 RepID=UPI0006490AC5|nr:MULTISPECIES: ATPase AAA [unclassified Rhizobium]MBN8952113.1 AAA family ATPase [Rhizobium tropici]OJY77945.1 MAG: AAA family ATPase [Rhizobium sp. 60-20]RKD56752.1 adenylate kinase family enzyme [Rhizobium sp. WW_1]
MEQTLAPQALVRAVDIDQAARILEKADRVLVIGCSGTGKSTLAQAIASLRVLTYVSMDRDIFWLPGWKSRPRPEAIALIEQAVAGPRWIMDGNSPSTLPLRLPRTDIVIWRRPPRYVALRGVISRWLRYRGHSRPEMAPGCPERLDWKFLRYIWTFERDEAPQFEGMLARHGGNVPVVTLKSYRDGEELLSLLRSKI